MTSVLQIIDYVGILVFAISGVLIGIEKKFDLIGASILGLVTAFGGGTLRDLLIGETPVTWMRNDEPIIIVLIAIFIAYLFRNTINKLDKVFFTVDTLGIALYTMLGLQKTLIIGLSPIAAILMGTVSAVFGGVIRDVLSNEVPSIFRREIYATACLTGGVTFFVSRFFIGESIFNMLTGMITIIVIRFLAVKYNWSLNFGHGKSSDSND
jgi:uncharacterized membrane protein YeiH